MEAWYPGVEGGVAIAGALFGQKGYNRFGKLPVTVYDSTFSSNVNMLDMSFTTPPLGRSYRYWRGATPLFEFGTGMSFTEFALRWLGGTPPPAASLVLSGKDSFVTLSVVVENTGSAYEGEEVVMLYHSPDPATVGSRTDKGIWLPARRLVDFERTPMLAPAATTTLHFRVNATQLGLVDTKGDTVLYAGVHTITLDRGVRSDMLGAPGASADALLQVDAVVQLPGGAANLLLDTLL